MTKLFVFEGPDGVGKTTTIAEVEKRLRLAGLTSVSLSFPGKEHGTIGAHVYKLHHDLASYDVTKLTPLSLQLLHIAAHVDAIECRLLPLLNEGTTVLLDRYWWSTWVYGIEAGIPLSQLEAIVSLEKLVWRGVVPTTVFLLSRSQHSATQHLVDSYNDLAKQEAGAYPVAIIKNEGAVQSVADEITRQILAAPNMR